MLKRQLFLGKIYVLGGISDGNKPLASIECYDPVTESWSAVDKLKENRYGHKVITAGGEQTFINFHRHLNTLSG